VTLDSAKPGKTRPHIQRTSRTR